MSVCRLVGWLTVYLYELSSSSLSALVRSVSHSLTNRSSCLVRTSLAFAPCFCSLGIPFFSSVSSCRVCVVSCVFFLLLSLCFSSASPSSVLCVSFPFFLFLLSFFSLSVSLLVLCRRRRRGRGCWRNM